MVDFAYTVAPGKCPSKLNWSPLDKLPLALVNITPGVISTLGVDDALIDLRSAHILLRLISRYAGIRVADHACGLLMQNAC
jgi:hypothetical protein